MFMGAAVSDAAAWYDKSDCLMLWNAGAQVIA